MSCNASLAFATHHNRVLPVAYIIPTACFRSKGCGSRERKNERKYQDKARNARPCESVINYRSECKQKWKTEKERYRERAPLRITFQVRSLRFQHKPSSPTGPSDEHPMQFVDLFDLFSIGWLAGVMLSVSATRFTAHSKRDLDSNGCSVRNGNILIIPWSSCQWNHFNMHSVPFGVYGSDGAVVVHKSNQHAI